ncbi:MAG: hypothetical protein ACLKAK_07135 [Alkaliphilus sp.]
MRIKKLCLANGDEYEDVEIKLAHEELKEAIQNREFIPIIWGEGKKVEINADFILSIEIRESKLKSI